ncbi:hypothetical protein DWX43_12205 [Clostridium sp. AF19-22AC]|jgi:exopolysaccharide biosynthesis predicted pyruvyltransferase EpsI|uniref:polysaccharide pyruvyl transferase family protein n=1 Tax=Clostridia TaxID=186801 RepID=UPI000E4814DF|nr:MULTISPECIES: polysaccharide pyruvyl transferase family protein [Clostridia]RHR28697.1 hypothetical protein DWX43_12205 [Clostridium sp. AF19-22AC]
MHFRNKLKRDIEIIGIIGALFSLKDKIIMFNTPVHGNLGDHAIAVGERKFIKDYFSTYKFIEIPEDQCLPNRLKLLRKYIRSRDLIMLQGGGFMGSLWPRHEVVMKQVLELFEENTKVIMPQTCFFEDGVIPQEYAQYYRKQKHLLICAREETSYNLFCQFIGDNSSCICVPDIVLINKIRSNENRSGIGICLREDKEKQRPNFVDDQIGLFAKEREITLERLTTVLSKSVSPKQRNRELKKILDAISSKKLLITDRLHGMIFAAITGTPCIALDNLSHKVSGVYAWIKTSLPYITCIDSKVFSMQLLNEYYAKESNIYDDKTINRKFDELAKRIDRMLER